MNYTRISVSEKTRRMPSAAALSASFEEMFPLNAVLILQITDNALTLLIKKLIKTINKICHTFFIDVSKHSYNYFVSIIVVSGTISLRIHRKERIN